MQPFRLEECDATGFVLGDYDFKVAGQNSLGNGPESEVATISVADDSLAQPTGLTLQVGPMNSVIAKILNHGWRGNTTDDQADSRMIRQTLG